jgi:hypothetical protein
MNESLGKADTSKGRVVEIGPDKVTIMDSQVVIDAKREMPDWKMRSFKVIPIYFENKKYYLADKRDAQKPHAVRYILKPWVDGKFDSATIFQNYDAETVAERDSSQRSEKRGEMAWAFLLIFYPFLGLLWSRTQQRLNRLGFVPRSITSLSIFTTFSLIFCQAFFVAISFQATARSGVIMIGGMIRAFAPVDHLQIGPVGIPLYIFDIVVTIAMSVDASVRYTQYLRDDEWVGGFLEWLFPKSLRSNG